MNRISGDSLFNFYIIYAISVFTELRFTIDYKIE